MQEINTKNQKAGRYLISLIREALRGEQLTNVPEGCSLDDVFALAESNSVEAMSYYGLSRNLVSDILYEKWGQKANLTLFRQLSFDAERETILTKMAEQGISYLPLKGILIVSYYPKPGMRSMADNDILYGILEPRDGGGVQPVGKNQQDKEAVVKKAQNQIKTFMEELGYEVESLRGNHDCYMKKPCFNFELHRQLMDNDSPMYSYYEDVWSRAIPDEKNPYAYSFSDEDEYIYFLAHAFKHFDNSGCGIRCVIDLYVFLQKKGEQMDWKYIAAELEKLELTEFEKKLKTLAYHAFEKGELDEQDEDILFYMLGCGTYGNLQTRINNSLDKLREESVGSTRGYKLRYWRERLFWNREKCKNVFPFFYKHHWLIVLLPFYRVIRGLFRHPGQLFDEFKRVWRHK